jgi:flagella basal body P-ring formation protein FlgA
MGFCRSLLLTSLTILLLMLAPLWPAEAVSIYLHRIARAGVEVLLLGDVATVTAAEPQQAETLRGLPLWRPSGKAEIVTAELIRRKLAEAVEGQVVVVGAYTSIMPSEATSPVEQEFYRQLLEAIAAVPGSGVGKLEIELLSRPEFSDAGQDAAGDSSTAVVDVELVPVVSSLRRRASGGYAGGLFQASYRITVRKSDGNTSVGEVRSLGLRVRQFIPVFIAARELPAGSVLSREVVELRDEEVAYVEGGFLSPDDRLEGFRTTTTVRRGERIDPSRLERHYLVRAGESVTLVFIRPGLRVTVPGRAYSSGAAGDRIEVRARDASRRFSGTVSPSGEVLVEDL